MFSQMKQSIFISSSIHRWWLTPVAIEGIFCFNIATSICCVCAGTTVVRLFSSLRVFLSNCDSDVFAKYSVVFPPEYVRLQLLSTWHKPRPLTARCFIRIKLNEQRTRRIRLHFFCISLASRGIYGRLLQHIWWFTFKSVVELLSTDVAYVWIVQVSQARQMVFCQSSKRNDDVFHTRIRTTRSRRIRKECYLFVWCGWRRTAAAN